VDGSTSLRFGESFRLNCIKEMFFLLLSTVKCKKDG